MNWWYILGILIIATIGFGVWQHYIDNALSDFSCWRGVISILAGSAAFVILIFCACLSISAPQEISVFDQQRAYIDTYKPDNEIENAALTSKKIELNYWLYNAQYQNKRWGGWQFYPDSVQDLEPIN